MSEFLADLFSRLKAAQGLQNGATAPQQAAPELLTLGEVMEKSFPDATRRNKINNEIVSRTLTKLVRTTDLATLRMASVSDRMATRRNRQTVFLNYLESQGAPAIINDYQYTFMEWNIGEDVAEVWNVENALPGEVMSNRPKRSNTLTCVGNTMNVSLIADEMAQQQVNIDIMAREIDMETTRIRRKMNSLLISSVEQKAEGAFAVPQLGGFVTRSDLYNVNASGGDLTRTLLQGRVDALANNADPQGSGYNSAPLLALTNARQLQVLRDIIISEYNGIDPMSRIAYERTLSSRLEGFNVPIEMVFEALPGGVVPFVLESALPEGTTIIFDADQPRLAKMRLMGQLGPWVMTRPTEKLQTLNVMFDLFSLEDPLRDSRAVITNHG